MRKNENKIEWDGDGKLDGNRETSYRKKDKQKAENKRLAVLL